MSHAQGLEAFEGSEDKKKTQQDAVKQVNENLVPLVLNATSRHCIVSPKQSINALQGTKSYPH